MAANRGKIAETLIKKALAAEKRQDLSWCRLPDARSGSFTPAIADFLVLVRGQMLLIEVKETLHSYRLSHNNFKIEQFARMRAWSLAGAQAFIIVYHSADKVWRLLPLDALYSRSGGSWDLRNIPVYSNVNDLFGGIYAIKN